MKRLTWEASTVLLPVLALAAPAVAQQFVQQGRSWSGSNVQIGLGASIALSGDGNLALVGGRSPFHPFSSGAKVWSRNRGVWSFDTSLPQDCFCGSNIKYGWSVALSADGNTALVGSPGDPFGSSFGSVRTFFRLGGIWTPGDTIVGSGAIGAQHGYSVALSADGKTAMVGAPGDNNRIGAAWIYVRTGVAWTQQGTELVGTGWAGASQQGTSVALSADGNTALVGGPADNGNAGAVWVFTRTGGAWAQQGNKLVGSGAVGAAQQGTSVALSADGNTAMVGGPGDNPATLTSFGATWAFTRTAGTWMQQGGKLFGIGSIHLGGPLGPDRFAQSEGSSVALSADGNKALIGSDIGMFVFKRSGGAWIQYGSMVVGSQPDFAATGVAISADGKTAVAGNPAAGIDYFGAIWFFAVPVIRDFNSDGLSDALLYDPVRGSSYTAMSQGDGGFSYQYNLFSSGFNILRAGDFNGDGKVDLALYNNQTGSAYISSSKGDGTFDFQSLFWSPGYDFVEMGDLNGDGKTDVVLYNSATGTMYAGISTGTGVFTYRYLLISPGFTFVRLADFTGDGQADLLLYNRGNGYAYLGVGDGRGGFTFNPLPISLGYDFGDTGDLNGDGKADVILYSSATGRAAVGISDGSGGLGFIPMQFSPGFASVRLADYTGNGAADLTLYNRSNGIGYFGTWDGIGQFQFQSLFWSPGYDDVVPEDVNGDGKADIILYNRTTGTSYTGISNGSGGFTYTYALWGTGKILAR